MQVDMNQIQEPVLVEFNCKYVPTHDELRADELRDLLGFYGAQSKLHNEQNDEFDDDKSQRSWHRTPPFRVSWTDMEKMGLVRRNENNQHVLTFSGNILYRILHRRRS